MANPGIRAALEEMREDYDNAAEAEFEGVPADVSPGGVTFGTDHYVEMWQPVGERKNRVYKKSTVLKVLAEKKRQRRDKEGRRTWFYRSELPQGWQSDSDAQVHKYRCVLEECPKKAQSARILERHVAGFHPGLYEVYKDRLIELVKAEAGDRIAEIQLEN